MVFCIENNQYGMGTSVSRHSSHSDYYMMGNQIPGIQIDGMNVLAVREGIRFAKDFCGTGNGPIFVEMLTYRYHGHSMSDPGTTYRNRDEVNFTRSTRDPLEYVKNILIKAGLFDKTEIKAIEKEIQVEVQKEVQKAKSFTNVKKEELFDYVYAKDVDGSKMEEVAFKRMPDYGKSI